jgi:GNAT superfamily N-acetyltransferase
VGTPQFFAQKNAPLWRGAATVSNLELKRLSAPLHKILVAKTDAQILGCFPVMLQLRPHLVEAEFVARVRRQQQEGYELVFLLADNTVKSLAGFRIQECLYSGRFLYVDDLATDESARSQGYGGLIFDWLVDRARQENCEVLRLDSGVQRFAAHRFYLRQRMEITCHHFALKLK